ncbi:MAG TPA: hypothetical protein VE079_15835 [Ensifer sp.]|nr:hypothetical protein [Ensifer sp.]
MLGRLMGAGLLLVALGGSEAAAGFKSWTTKVEDDPFSGGTKVTVDFASSLTSGILIRCDTSQNGMMVRSVPGFRTSDALKDYKPILEFAIDGKRLLGQQGETATVGNDLAVAQVQLTHYHAEALAYAFTKAKKQIAIKDGISDRPFLLGVSGSSKAGAALTRCLGKQVTEAPKTETESVSDVDMLTPAGRFVEFQALALAAQDKCPDYRLKPQALEHKDVSEEDLKVVADMVEGSRRAADKTLADKSCFAALREPLRYGSLPFDQVWEKK